MSVDCIDQLQVGKVINIDVILDDDHDLVFMEPHRLDKGLET